MKIKSLLDTYCTNETDIRLIFIPFKVGQYFSAKCLVLKSLASRVVYWFACASCNACYIGESARHITTRVHELFTDKKSSIFKHLKQNGICRAECNEDCFINQIPAEDKRKPTYK